MADFDLEQDDISSGFDDDGEMSVAEQERRQAEFQKQVRKNMEIIVKPKQFDANKRREAIRWLGEAGDPEAIPALLKVYQKDKTPGMKEEAAYALGQFKALGEALDDPETEEEALDILDKIVLHKKFGKRANALPLILGEVALLILAVVLFGVGAVAMGTVAGPRNATRTAMQNLTETARPTATQDTEEIMRSQVLAYYEGLFEDATNYQFQLAAAGRGDSIDCSGELFNYPSVYNLSPMWSGNADYARAVDLLNEAHGLLDSVNQPYQTACVNNRAIPQEEALSLARSVIDAQRKLDEALAALNAVGIEVTEQALMTNTPRPTDPAAPSQTPDLSFVNADMISVESIIGDMMATQGAALTLQFYWQQVITSNSIYMGGCNQLPPTIPADYILPTNNQGLYIQLDNAVANLNTGLQLLRDASNAFYSMCSTQTVPDDATRRADQVTTAINAFNSAQAELTALRGR